MTAAVLTAYDAYTRNIGYEPPQPVEYSHKVHAGDFGIKCLYCHYNAGDQAASNIPTTRDCMVCHIALNVESELIIPLNNSYDEEVPIQWNRVYRVPDFARFDHSVHTRTGTDCSVCHGEVETMEKVVQVQEITMAWCLDCHRDPKKYIIREREISGIFTTNETMNIKRFFESYQNTYGDYFLPKGNLEQISRIPENCSVCHY